MIVDIEIHVDNRAKKLEYFVLEDKDLNPKIHFKFVGGKWIGQFNRYTINSDNDIDIFLVLMGNPEDNCEMTVFVNKIQKDKFNLFKPFNKNGYAHFSKTTPL